jgi:hypothetical protein
MSQTLAGPCSDNVSVVVVEFSVPQAAGHALQTSPPNENVAARLRRLTNEFSEGLVSFEEYRRLRAPLLDSLEPPAQSRLWSLLSTSSRTGRIGTPVLAALVAVAAGAFLLRDHVQSGPSASHVASPLQPQNSAKSDRIYALVAPLLDNPDWGDARIAAVNASLLEEGSHQIAARQQTEWFQRFAAEVRRRLEKQRARGTDRLVPQKSSLAALAVTIGLNLNALDEPLRPPPRGESSTAHCGSLD